MKDEALRSIATSLVSPNCLDSNLEPANVVDGLYAIANALESIARAIEGRTEIVK